MALAENRVQYHQFKLCVITHHKALEFFGYLQKCTQNMFLLVVAINMILISTTAVQILMHMDRPLDSTRFILFFLCSHFHLYVISLFGQIVLNHSTVLAKRIYNCNWYEVPIKFQKLLCFMIVRSSKPCILSAGGLYDMNMQNYAIAVKTCMSYFTMFLSMRE
nr:PREDICTED: odorant receptor 4-like isoform X2 [Megachile rotundata]